MTKIVVIYVEDAMTGFRLHRIKNSLGDLYEGVKVSSSLDFKSLDCFVTYKYLISHWRATLAPTVKTCTKYFQPPKSCFGSIPVQHHPQVLYQLLFLYQQMPKQEIVSTARCTTIRSIKYRIFKAKISETFTNMIQIIVRNST